VSLDKMLQEEEMPPGGGGGGGGGGEVHKIQRLHLQRLRLHLHHLPRGTTRQEKDGIVKTRGSWM
jgi:hypothetical protein